MGAYGTHMTSATSSLYRKSTGSGQHRRMRQRYPSVYRHQGGKARLPPFSGGLLPLAITIHYGHPLSSDNHGLPLPWQGRRPLVYTK